MTKIFWSVLLLIGMIGSAAAQCEDCINVAGVPAPDVGGGVVGMLLATGAVYLIKRRAH